MNYEVAEIEILERVNEEITASGSAALYDATVMPETEIEYKRFYANYTKTRVAVQFINSIPFPSNGVGAVSQDETMRFRLTFEAKKLRGAGGLYSLMDIVKRALIGFKMTNAITPLSYTKYDVLEFEQGSIQPYLEFECKGTNVQTFNKFEGDQPINNLPITVHR